MLHKSILIGLISASSLVFILGVGFVFYLIQFFRRELLVRIVSKWWISSLIAIWVVTVAIIALAWTTAASSQLLPHPAGTTTGLFLGGFVLTIVITLVTIYFLPQYAVGFDEEYLYLLGEKIELALLTSIEVRGRFVLLWYQTNRGRRLKLRWFKGCATTKFMLQHQKQILVKDQHRSTTPPAAMTKVDHHQQVSSKK